MTEIKRLTYQLEDTFILGKSLPVVAMRQLPKIADALDALPDDPAYLSGTQRAMSANIRQFIESNKHFMDDERDLLAVFTRACKLNRYGHHALRIYEA